MIDAIDTLRLSISLLLRIIISREIRMAEAVLIEKAYIKLTENRYPEGATKAARKSIRKKAETLTVIDGVPYHQKKNGKKVGFECDDYLDKIQTTV